MFFAKVVKPDLTKLHKILGQSVNRAENNLKKFEGGGEIPPPVAYRVKMSCDVSVSLLFAGCVE